MSDAHKPTKKENFIAIAEILTEAGYDELAEAAMKEVTALDAKALKAKERAAIKAETPDELKILVASAITSEPQTAAEIFDIIKDEMPEATVGKVRARLTQLVKDEAIVKNEIKVNDGEKTREVMAYNFA